METTMKALILSIFTISLLVVTPIVMDRNHTSSIEENNVKQIAPDFIRMMQEYGDSMVSKDQQEKNLALGLPQYLIEYSTIYPDLQNIANNFEDQFFTHSSPIFNSEVNLDLGDFNLIIDATVEKIPAFNPLDQITGENSYDPDQLIFTIEGQILNPNVNEIQVLDGDGISAVITNGYIGGTMRLGGEGYEITPLNENVYRPEKFNSFAIYRQSDAIEFPSELSHNDQTGVDGESDSSIDSPGINQVNSIELDSTTIVWLIIVGSSSFYNHYGSQTQASLINIMSQGGSEDIDSVIENNIDVDLRFTQGWVTNNNDFADSSNVDTFMSNFGSFWSSAWNSFPYIDAALGVRYGDFSLTSTDGKAVYGDPSLFGSEKSYGVIKNVGGIGRFERYIATHEFSHQFLPFYSHHDRYSVSYSTCGGYPSWGNIYAWSLMEGHYWGAKRSICFGIDNYTVFSYSSYNLARMDDNLNLA